MAAVRAVASADSWSLSTGLKGYLSCCFSKATEPAAASSSGDAKATAADSSDGDKDTEPGEADRGCSQAVDRRLEADGASVYSAANSSVAAADRLGGADMTSSHGAGATSYV